MEALTKNLVPAGCTVKGNFIAILKSSVECVGFFCKACMLLSFIDSLNHKFPLNLAGPFVATKFVEKKLQFAVVQYTCVGRMQ